MSAPGHTPSLRVEDSSGRVETIDVAVQRLATRFAEIGLSSGEVVAVTGSPLRDAIPTLLGALSAGLVVLPIARAEPAARRDDLLRRSGTRVLVGASHSGDDVTPIPFASLASRAGERVPGAPRDGRPLPAPGTLVATSGSAGAPKLVAHALDAHIASAWAASAALGLDGRDRYLVSLPIHHVAGLAIVFRAQSSGATLVLPRDDERLASAVARLRPTAVSVVATQLAELIADDDALDALREMRVVLAGGGPIPGGLRRRAIEARVPLHVSYGATETASMVAVTGDPDLAARDRVAGRAISPSEISVGPEGTLRVSGPTLLAGYLVDGALVDPRARDGSYPTADRGHVDGRGVVHVTGREDLVFISGGENVDPLEIEATLARDPRIHRIVVVPREDDRFGRVPVAFVRIDRELAVSALVALAAECLPRHARPRDYYALDVSGRMKPDRAALAARVATGELAPLG